MLCLSLYWLGLPYTFDDEAFLIHVNDGGAASDHFGGDRPQPFEDAPHGEMMPLADDAPLPPRRWRQESGGREPSGDFGDSREERGRGEE